MGREQIGKFEKEWDLDRGSVEVVPRVLPVTVVDDVPASESTRSWPKYMIRIERAGVAAVYSIVGLRAGVWPIRVTSMNLAASGAGHTFAVWGRTELRAANLASAIGVAESLNRGGAGATADALSGTTTVAPAANRLGAPYYHITAMADPLVIENPVPGAPFVLLPGEYVWLWANSVNIMIIGQFAWEELYYQIPQGAI